MSIYIPNKNEKNYDQKLFSHISPSLSSPSSHEGGINYPHSFLSPFSISNYIFVYSTSPHIFPNNPHSLFLQLILLDFFIISFIFLNYIFIIYFLKMSKLSQCIKSNLIFSSYQYLPSFSGCIHYTQTSSYIFVPY